jgi:hypothetical protein
MNKHELEEALNEIYRKSLFAEMVKHYRKEKT